MPDRAQTPPGFPSLAPEPAQVVSRRYHLHPPGFAYAGVAVVLFLGAVNGQNNLLFWLFGLAAAGLIVSGFVSGAVLMRLRLERITPPVAQVDAPLAITYRLRNTARFIPALALIVEELTPQRQDSSRLAPGRAFAAHVPARGEVTVESTGEALRRGHADLSLVRVWTTFPFGLMKKSVTFRQDERLLVRPPVPDVPASVLGLRPRGYAGLESRRPLRTGEEFHSLREYAPGDSTRRIAWKASARRGVLISREHSGRHLPRLWITPVADPDPARTDAVAAAAAGVASLALRRGLAVGLALGTLSVMPIDGPRHLAAILDALARWDHAPGAAETPPGLRPDDQRLFVAAPGASVPAADLLITTDQAGVAVRPLPGARRRALLTRAVRSIRSAVGLSA